MSKNKHLILWANDKPFPYVEVLSHYELIEVQSEVLAFQFLQQHKVSIFIGSSKFGINFYKDAILNSVNTIFALYIEQIDKNELIEHINLNCFNFIINQDDTKTNLNVFLKNAIAEFENKSQRNSLLKEILLQNKKLESLNNDLENIVEERTAHIESAKKDEDEKLGKSRSLIKFIKELGMVDNFEDLMQTIRIEFKKFAKIGDPILLIEKNQRSVVYSFQMRQMFKIDISNKLPLNMYELPSFLANIFARPFAKSMTMDLDLNSNSNSKGYLCFENFNNDIDTKKIMISTQERLESISLVVDRLLLHQEFTNIAFRWEKTFDFFVNPISIIDIDYEVIRANKSFSNKKSKNKCYEQFGNKNKSCEGCPLISALEKSSPQQGIIIIDDRMYQVNSYPILFQNGKAVNVVNHYVDITKSRQLYMKMLQGEKLSALGLLAGNIAHELNNPLTGLRSLAQVLLSEQDPKSEIYHDLQEIEKASARSQKIIKNLLEFSTQDHLTLSSIDFDEVLEKTMPMLKAVFKNHRINVNLKSKGILFKAETQLIQQVLFNLVNNACQAMKSIGTLSISSGVFYDKIENKEYVYLSVKDTGPGMTNEISKRIFEPFFTTKPEGQGTGLGLSLSKEIVEKFGGRITVESQIDIGSEFKIFFPTNESLNNENINN